MRGMDSTGIGTVLRPFGQNKEPMVHLAKEIGHFGWLFDDKSFDKAFAGTLCCAIGHNRSKTVGAVTRRNAHPFNFEHVMGAHNGTLDYRNKNALESGSSFDTDSEALFNNLELYGIEDTIHRLEDTEAWALAWFDRRDFTINLLRNKERPMCFGFANEGKTLFWASLPAILRAAIGCIEGVSLDNNTVFSLPEDTWYSWRIPEHTHEKLPDPVRQTVKAPERWAKKKEQKQTMTNTTGAKQETLFKPGFTYDWHFIHVGPTVWREGKRYKWGGDGLGYVEEHEFKDKLSQVISDGKAKLDQLEKKIIAASSRQNIMTTEDVKKKKAWEHVTKSNEEPKITDKWFPLFQANPNLRLYFSKETSKFQYFRYDPIRMEWNHWTDSDAPPPDARYPIVDVENGGSHRFIHEGKAKKGNKKIYYKGWKGKKIDRETFESYMKEGCAHCNGHPEWGNEVSFIGPTHEFLCYFCDWEENREFYINLCKTVAT